MSNALSKLAGTSLAVPSPEALIGLLEQNALGSSITPPTGDLTQFVKFDGNTGILSYGKDGAALPAHQKYVVPLMGMQHGWLFWANATPEKATEVVVSALQPLPGKPDDRGVVGSYPKPRERDGWQTQWSLAMTGYGGELDGISMSWPGTARGYQQFWSGLVVAFRDRLKYLVTTGGDPAMCNPILTIRVDSYYHNTYRKTVYTPLFTIEAWTDGVNVEEAAPVPMLQAAGAAAGADPLDGDIDPLG